jgi:hypothetical protein
MPNFDGAGPLKRGRVIGRELGHCKKDEEFSTCERKDALVDSKEKPDSL